MISSVEPSVNPVLSAGTTRIVECLRAGVVKYVRMSTPRQFVESIGSKHYQRAIGEGLRVWGIDPSKIPEVGGAESALGGNDRPAFRELIARIRSGEFKLVVTAFADRLSRNDADWLELRSAVTETRGMFFIEGRFYDPLDEGERLLLDLQSSIARHDNQQRRIRLTTARCFKAKHLQYRIPLQTGLVWASPRDARYVRALEDAGLAHHLADLESRHQTRATLGNEPCYILPFPDREVWDACMLRRQVLLEHRDLRAVLDLVVRSGTDWPRRGHVPLIRRTQRYYPEDGVRWVPVREFRTDDMRSDWRTQIANWFRSPTVYGIYAHREEGEHLSDAVRALLGAEVWVPNAFPAFFTSDEHSIVKELLGSRLRTAHFPGMSTPDTATSRPIPYHRLMGAEPLTTEIFCGARLRSGATCGNRMTFTMNRQTKWRHVIHNVRCYSTHPLRAALSVEAEEVILQRILSHFSPEAVEQAIGQWTLDDTGLRLRLRSLRKAEAEHIETIAYVTREMIEAERRDNQSLVQTLRAQLERLALDLQRCQRDAKMIEVQLPSRRLGPESDWTAIRSLAGDLPALFAQGQKIPGVRQQLMRLLTRRIWVRRVAAGTDFIEIEYPTGVREGFLFTISPADCTDDFSEWAATQLRDTIRGSELTDPSKASLEAANALVPVAKRYWNSRRQLTGPLLRYAAIRGVYRRDVTTREFVSVRSLATRLDRPRALCEQWARSGKFGPAYPTRAGTRFAPTEAELCERFRWYGKTVVCRAKGWTRRDVVTLGSAARMASLSIPAARLRAAARGGLAHDPSHRIWVRWSTLLRGEYLSLADAIAERGLPGVQASDFVIHNDAMKWIRRRVGPDYYFHGSWARHADRSGRALTLVARPASGDAVRFVYLYLPEAIRELPHREQVIAWLEGRLPNVTAWQPIENRLTRARGRVWVPPSRTRRVEEDAATDGNAE